MKKELNKGTIIIIALWIMTLLALFAIGFAYRIGIDLKLTGYELNKRDAFYIAKSGIEKGIAELVKDKDNEEVAYDSLNESWSSNEGIFKDVEVGSGKFSLSYMVEGTFEEETYFGMQDEESKININEVDRAVLLNLPGITEAIADSIIAWRDEEEDAEEDMYYKGKKPSYSCKDSKFDDLSELYLVKGLDDEDGRKLVHDISGMITVFGDGKVNFNTASEDVIIALGLSENLTTRVIEFRNSPDGNQREGDNGIFESVELEHVSQNLGLEDLEKTEMGIFLSKERVDVKSNIFRIDSTGTVERGKRKIKEKITAIVDRGSGEEDSQHILWWRER